MSLTPFWFLHTFLFIYHIFLERAVVLFFVLLSTLTNPSLFPKHLSLNDCVKLTCTVRGKLGLCDVTVKFEQNQDGGRQRTEESAFLREEP